MASVTVFSKPIKGHINGKFRQGTLFYTRKWRIFKRIGWVEFKEAK